jgi:hypothetical protein
LLADTAAGSWAGPIGAGVALVVGLIAGFWAAHAARVAGAKDENAAINSAVTAFDQSIKALFDAANKGQIQAADAVNVCEQIRQQFWQGMAPHMTGPGRADTSNFGQNCGTVDPSNACAIPIGAHACDKHCTAGCCVGCHDIMPVIVQAQQVFQAGGGTVTVCKVYGSHYGANARESYTLTYKPPSAETITSALAAIASGAGLGGSSSLLPLLAAGVALWAVMR